MEATEHSSCPSCGSARLHWHVERAGRRGQPLTARSIVWRCPACDARFAGPDGDGVAGGPASDGGAV